LADPRLSGPIAFAETHAGVVAPPGLEDVTAGIADGVEAASTTLENEQRAIIQIADPDSDPEQFQHVEGRKTNPCAPLFQAAADRASRALQSSREAVALTGNTVRRLLAGIASVDELNELRQVVVRANEAQLVGGLHVNVALKFKGLGDEAADRDNGRD